jgi:riboflavin synthase
LFTGIIEEIGIVRQISGGAAGQLTIAAQTVLEGTRLGDSLAVNGVCLTVTRLDGRSFSVDVMPQTLRQSNLGRLHVGSPANLERAVPPAGRLGGHLVQGHADGVGQIVRTAREENALWVTIAAPAEVMRYIVPRAFIAVDGASLTVARVEAGRFAVSLIPHTQATITLPQQPIGAAVNLEVDIVARYVERLLQGGPEGAGVDWKQLAQHGII